MKAEGHSRTEPMRVAFLVQRVGPYHDARLRAHSGRPGQALHVIEFRPQERVYAWDPIGTTGGYARTRLGRPEDLEAALDQIAPAVVVCVGYSDPEIHRAVRWGMRRGIPLVTCSDSTHEDEPRTPTKELLKGAVVAAFDAALVAGSRSDDYLRHLGMSGAVRFRAWDVVDNRHFEAGANEARRAAKALRNTLALPDRYFFCSARFVAKKNLAGLIQAYGIYLKNAGPAAWSLVVAGSGPLDGALKVQARTAGVGDRIRFPGFLQYQELPAYYGLAEAFVLPSSSDQWGLVVNEAMAAGLPVLVSSRCGCSADLVHEGENGFTFNPDDPAALARVLGDPAECPRSHGAAVAPDRRGVCP